jgi:hypothetical protein
MTVPAGIVSAAGGQANTQGERPWFKAYKDVVGALLLGRFSGGELKVVLAVWRLTDGHFNRRRGAFISRRTIAAMTGLNERTVSKTVPRLIGSGVLQEVEPARPGRAPKLAIEPDPHSWGRFAPRDTVLASNLSPTGYRFSEEDDCEANLSPTGGVTCSPQATGNLLPTGYSTKELLKNILKSGDDAAAPRSGAATSPSEDFFVVDGNWRITQADWDTACQCPDTQAMYVARWGRPDPAPV